MKSLFLAFFLTAQIFALNQTFNGNVVITGTLTVGGSFTPTGAVLAPNGTVGAPGIAFAADADGSGLGEYRVAANVLGFSSNGVQVGKYDSSGDWFLGIDNTSTLRIRATEMHLNEGAVSAQASKIFNQGSATNGSLAIGGGSDSPAVSGSGFVFYGHTHATKADKIEGYSANTLSLTANAAGVYQFVLGLRTPVAITNTANPPTNAEVVAAFGAAATTGSGFVAIMDDNNGHANEVLIWSDGTKYWYATGTAAP